MLGRCVVNDRERVFDLNYAMTVTQRLSHVLLVTHWTQAAWTAARSWESSGRLEPVWVHEGDECGVV